ncbi:hypothetical protein Msip34_2866 (plasmid) [Methylovorus glucosotrophus SIP3-4]|uniref:Uncharacterized protein n=1 Tax=Methylovorus glucosotrophus (strain SIP3-4) TaxID=582744 RepID=C6XEN3_METGS|nr:hypothetical protein Msip34_2866 [Methylovorus glucosotrophus SIP3-4]
MSEQLDVFEFSQSLNLQNMGLGLRILKVPCSFYTLIH